MVEGREEHKKNIYFMIVDLLRSNYEFLFFLSISYSIYILYKKGKNLELINKFPIELNRNKGNWLQKFWFCLTLLVFIICFYYISKNFLGFNYISNNEYRRIKLILGLFISILTLFINIKEKGFKSWKTLFSIFSLCILIFYASLIFDEDWKIFIYEKLNNYLIACSVWIFIFISFFSHEYLYLSNIDIINSLRIKLVHIPKWELENKPNMMKAEDNLNKKDSINNKSNENFINRSNNNLPVVKSRSPTPEIIDSDSDSASIKSHDSTVSNAHISITESVRKLYIAADLFTEQWKKGKILGEDAKEKKEMLDKIIDLPDEKVFDLLHWRIDWEHDEALLKFIRKRNMPEVPRDQLVGMANAAFDEIMSNKEEKQKFWTRLKTYVKEPIKDENNVLEKIRKETLSLYIKGEEEAITIGDKKKNPIEIGGRKFKKGGLIAIYEDKKIDAEASLQQQELRIMKKGKEVKRIIPSLGRLSIFEIMNQSVGSVIHDFKKLNISSSTTSSDNSEIKTNLVKFQSNLKDQTEVDVKDSLISNDNNTETGKSISIKGENNELNKKRRLN